MSKDESLKVINENVAGIDIGSLENWVSVSPNVRTDNVMKFGAFANDLYKIAKWLKECNVESVIMESTGIYWVPLFEVLESYKFEVFLCNASYAKNLPGRKKTDKYDCDWLRKLHSYGMLNSSFIPEKSIRELKVITRYRDNLTKELNIHIQRMQKSLTLMNFYLPKVVSNIMGKTGLEIIKSIIKGETNPEKLVMFRDPGIKASKEEMIKALKGNIEQEHLFVLKSSLELYIFTKKQIEECDSNIDKLFSKFYKVTSKPLTVKKNKKITMQENDFIKY